MTDIEKQIDEVLRKIDSDIGHFIIDGVADQENIHRVFAEAKAALQALLTARYDQAVNDCLAALPGKATGNVGFTFGEGKLPLTLFEIGYNEAIDQATEALRGLKKGKE